MSTGLNIDFETTQVEKAIAKTISKLNNPTPLLNLMKRWIHAQTMKMFIGRRPDRTPVRGVSWPRLKQSTINQKKQLVKKGKALVADRPMVRTGKLRDSLKVLQSNKNGFTYGTTAKSKKGFQYPGHWNIGKFKWLFLNKNDYAQIVKMTVDFLKDRLKNHKNYT